MSTFLDDAIQRTLGDALALQPRIPARFEPSPAAPALWSDSVPAEDTAQPGAPVQSPRSAASTNNPSSRSLQPLSSFPPAPETPGPQFGAQPPAQHDSLLPAAPAARPIMAAANQRPAFAPGATDASSLQPQRSAIPPSPTSGQPQQEPPSPATRSAAPIQPMPIQPMPKPPAPIEPAVGSLLPESPAIVKPVSGTGAHRAPPAVSVRVHIGRIEMQPLPQQPGPPRPAPRRAEQQRATAASLRPAHSLDEYLGRKGRRR